jgi:hypothetical protein
MKKLLIITLLFSHFSSFALDDGSDKIIKKYLKAIGGAKEWEGVKTIKTTMHEENRHLGEYFYITSILRDKGYRQEHTLNTEIKVLQGGTPSVKGYFNEIAWDVFNVPIQGIADAKKDSILKQK